MTGFLQTPLHQFETGYILESSPGCGAPRQQNSVISLFISFIGQSTQGSPLRSRSLPEQMKAEDTCKTSTTKEANRQALEEQQGISTDHPKVECQSQIEAFTRHE